VPYAPEVEPDPAAGAPEPVDGVEPDADPLPMFGQLGVEPEPELDEPDEPELALLEPEFELLEPDGVVVEEFVLALEPVDPVFDELVVAALATRAPPVTRPVVSAPMATTLRNRILMVVALSVR
jgi:hypothetical protein